LHHRFANSGKFERWPLRRRGKDIDVSPPSAAIVNTIEPLISMAEQGLGIACLPDFAIRKQLAEGTLRTVLDDYVEHAALFHLLRPSQRYVPRRFTNAPSTMMWNRCRCECDCRSTEDGRVFKHSARHRNFLSQPVIAACP
jgi:hypothetical protein